MTETNWSEVAKNARRLASALSRLGLDPQDRIGTLAWNTNRHFEVYFAVAGMGAVCHTINPRLFPEQIVYIANHAEDKYLFFDLTFVPLVEKLLPQLKTVKGFVVIECVIDPKDLSPVTGRYIRASARKGRQANARRKG